MTKNIDPNQVYELARKGCTFEEIAQKLRTTRQLIENTYANEYQNGKVELKIELREAQLSNAYKNTGNSTMLIWLGKIHLGQREVAHEERIAELDMLIKHLDLKAECLNLAKSS